MTSHYRTRMARGERGVIPVIAEKPLPDFADVGTTVRVLRARASIRQGVLADRAGLAQSTVSKIENGHRPPDKRSLLAIARALTLTSSATDRLLAAAGYQRGGAS